MFSKISNYVDFKSINSSVKYLSISAFFTGLGLGYFFTLIVIIAKYKDFPEGIIGIIASSRHGNVAASFPVDEGDEIILSTDKGKVIRCAVKEIRTAGRNTQGVRIIKLSGEEKVVSAIKIDDNFV